MDKFVVIVDFEVQPGKSDEVIKLVSENARNSVANEPGCYQFDVMRVADQPDRLDSAGDRLVRHRASRTPGSNTRGSLAMPCNRVAGMPSNIDRHQRPPRLLRDDLVIVAPENR